MSSQFSRVLPPRPDLAQQRTQAKELLERFAEADVESVARVRAALPDKRQIALADAQFVVAREYGFVSWAELKRHIESLVGETARSPWELAHEAFQRRDARAVRKLLSSHAELRAGINEPAFSFDSPAIVAFANDLPMVDVLLEFGADPNRRSDWWAGGFHALYSATGAAAEKLLAAGAEPDACAAAHLDRIDLLARMIADDPACVHQRGGDGQTPLHFARSREVIDLLLAHGADVDARDVDHRSTAAEWMLAQTKGAGRYDLAQYLVERGASADIFLAAALGLTERTRTMLEREPALLDLRTGRGEYGEQPPSSYHIYFWTIGDGRSPMDVAAQFGQLEALRVMQAFASPRQRFLLACRLGDEPAARALLREHPDIVASMPVDDHRAISDAAWSGDAKSVALMLELGFDPRTPGQDSGTALHCAAWQGSVETVRVLLTAERVRDLLELRDARYHSTPLGWCCHGSQNGDTSRDHAGVAELLLEAGAQQGENSATASPAVERVLARWRRDP
jgi:ankyrin repeat protein